MIINDNVQPETINSVLEPVMNDLQLIEQSSHYDPFSILGKHGSNESSYILVYSPNTKKLTLTEKHLKMLRVNNSDFFIYPHALEEVHYLINCIDMDDNAFSYHDPYSFSRQISDFDLNLFSSGQHLHIYKILGSHSKTINGIEGVLFATWAPNASRVSVIGDFNNWDGRRYPMRSLGESGVWELFIPELDKHSLYKFEIKNRDSGD